MTGGDKTVQIIPVKISSKAAIRFINSSCRNLLEFTKLGTGCQWEYEGELRGIDFRKVNTLFDIVRQVKHELLQIKPELHQERLSPG